MTVEILDWVRAAELREKITAATTLEELRAILTQIVDILTEDITVN